MFILFPDIILKGISKCSISVLNITWHKILRILIYPTRLLSPIYWANFSLHDSPPKYELLFFLVPLHQNQFFQNSVINALKKTFFTEECGVRVMKFYTISYRHPTLHAPELVFSSMGKVFYTLKPEDVVKWSFMQKLLPSLKLLKSPWTSLLWQLLDKHICLRKVYFRFRCNGQYFQVAL